MAKGLRASVKKSNRQKLRTKVFAPVNDARTQRLHEKLLELVQQPKPELVKDQSMEVDSADDEATKAENGYAKAQSRVAHSAMMSPRATFYGRALDSAQTLSGSLKTDTCSSLLNVFSKLVLTRIYSEMDVDGDAAATTTSSSNLKNKKINKSKLKKRQKPRNQISFPKSKGKGALKPFSNSRVSKRRS
ncbi:hypothetical protein GQ43DRAFT_461571 [Delitschia confertaspora ATCC 74209]|uniref:DUF2423 domain-containing protein n=1 Tax=Delitschia confertaspora ATCC 74209 TaxID=1513339 RepID=A0A9P4MRV8_9PLEO|nr:hypothetical protein GQ43DRAFT_461571 [Delitschia confertaspora ATCC 74209]